jgi:SagB-type dehydrogenase family enzyme
VSDPRPTTAEPARSSDARPAEHTPTVRLASVTGAHDVAHGDPTEDYHEASRVYPGIVDPLVVGAQRLELSHEMRVSASRSVKRHHHRPFRPFPVGDLGAATLATALARRRSTRSYGPRPLRLDELGTILHAAYGVTGTLDGTTQSLRTPPSGGALYPLELYVACRRVEGLDRGLYHYDPLRHGLELLRTSGCNSLEHLSPYHDPLSSCAALVAMTAMFWRSRFKYGARAYRFTLIEAGHAAQNLLLAVAALGLAAVPIGGFYDRRVDDFLGIDGLHEGSLYLLPVGPPPTR